mmetsp:Transcript_37273/g.105230  ORF Transcript_37273/g.105230 Transcript_37273/m.105230 type:complete len:762 (-) Transcript_37273:85-2370(-)
MSRSSSGLKDTFRKPDFNLAEFVRDATGQGEKGVTRLTQQLEDYASTLDEELQRKIIACHDELLQNAGSINDLDGHLGDVREVVQALKGSVERVRGDVLSPFQSVKRRTVLLERMLAVNVLVRKLLRFLFDARKLRTQMEAPAKDFSKAAHTLYELELVLQESSVERIDVLRAEVAWIRETGARVRRQADDDLRSGIKQSNQITLSVALQVFFNLRCLWPQLKRVLAEMLDEFAQSPLPAGSGFQQYLEVGLQLLMAQTQRIYLLDEQLRSKTDPLTHRTFAAALEDEGVGSLTGHFWTEATAIFKAKIARVLQDRASRRALVDLCPKVLHALTDALDKVNMASRGRAQILRAAEREALYAAVADLRNEFLAESVRRVTDPVGMMLPDKLLNSLAASGGAGNPSTAGEGSVTDELPTSHDLRRYVQLLVAEVERCECCPELLLRDAVRHVRSSVLAFAARLEQVVDSSCVGLQCFEDEARLQLRSPLPMPAAGHARNARLFGIAYHTLAALRETVPARFQSAVITQHVQSALQQTPEAIVAPMMGTLQRAVMMSAGQLAAGGGGRMGEGSPGVAAVAQLCTHVNRYYFALFGSGQLLPYVNSLCAAMVRAALSAAVLVRPCDGPVQAALAQDLQAVEATAGALNPDFQANLRHEASALREFRKLLSAKGPGSVDLGGLLGAIPLHLLLAYAVHQLPGDLPALPAASGTEPGAYLEKTLLPLWDDEGARAPFKASVAEYADAHNLDATESPTVAFIIQHSMT